MKYPCRFIMKMNTYGVFKWRLKNNYILMNNDGNVLYYSYNINGIKISKVIDQFLIDTWKFSNKRIDWGGCSSNNYSCWSRYIVFLNYYDSQEVYSVLSIVQLHSAHGVCKWVCTNSLYSRAARWWN